MKHHRAKVVLALSVATWVFAAAVPVSTPAAQPPPSPDDLTDAARFRTSFNFPIDASTLTNAALDRVRFPNTEFGVPLTTAEAAEVHRRIKVQEGLGETPVFAATLAGSAGTFVDQEAGGVPVFLFTGDGSRHSAALASRLPAGIEYRIQSAEYTMAQLEDLQSRIEAARDALNAKGFGLVLTGIDVRANRVIVGLAEPTAAKTAALEGQFGRGFYTRQEGSSHADACTYRDCWLPQKNKGGIHIYKTNGQFPCTSGFIVRRAGTSTYAVLTAGHCLAVQGGANQRFRHGDAAVYNVGDSKSNTWFNGADADAGIIDILSTTVPSPKNSFHAGGGTIRSLNAVKSHASQVVGLFVCRSGLGTGAQTCGHIFAVNVTRNSEVTGVGVRSIQFQVEVDFDSKGGDSGGPMYASNTGFGIHVDSQRPDGVGKHGWYSTLEFARREYFNVSGLSYNFCLTSDCSLQWP